jgi:hypothetical protein
MREFALSLVCLVGFIACSGSVEAQLPDLVQHTAQSNTRGINQGDTEITAGGTYNLTIANGTTLAGNAIVVGMTCDNSNSPTVTVSDDAGNAYTQASTATDNTKLQISKVFVALNVRAGASVIRIKVSSRSAFCSGMATEFSNIALTNAVDCSHAAVSSGSVTVSSGSCTTTANGDLIYQYMTRNCGSPTTYVSGGSPFSFLSVDRNDGHAAQWGIQQTAGSVDPHITLGGSRCWGSVTVALKAASAGTPRPTTGLWILRAQHNNTQDETSPMVTLQTPTSGGNLFVVAQSAGGTYALSSTTPISDGTNAYSFIGCRTVTPNSACLAYSKNYSPADTRTVTITMNGSNSGGHGATFLTYEIAGANTTDPLDRNFGSNGFASANGNQAPSGSGGPFTTFTATPGGQNELAIVVGSMAADTATGWSSPAGMRQVATTYTGEGNPSNTDENNPAGIYYNGSSTWAITPTCTHDTLNSNGVGTWAVAGAMFKW